ncbi:MAG: glycosyltransferase [Candidatus Omnitrophota bacterium]
MKKKISIIIRTKNEERWITQCLKGVFAQSYKDFEVILVDNMSEDKTVEKAKQFGITSVVSCEEFLPGKAINAGVRRSHGDYIVCLSGHCIPVDDRWLEHLLDNFNDGSVAGVYGRQEPMEFTPDSDKRDLALVFGLDRKVQLKDSFFHNANSMIRRDVWERIPFDEKVTNIEDRVWAKEALDKGYKIVYEPRAGVYHYHGIHQNGDKERCANVVNIMELLHDDYNYKSLEIDKFNIVAFIPVRGDTKYVGGRPLLYYTVKRAGESKYIKKIIVSTDNANTAEIAKTLGAEAPFIRDPAFSDPRVNMAQVLRHSLEKIEALNIFPDIIVSLEPTFPFRPKGLIDNMIMELASKGFDTVIAVRRENKAIWKEREKRIRQLEEGLTPRQYKDPAFIELKGVACVTHPASVRQGSMLGDKIGIYEVNDPYSHLEVRSEEDIKMAAHLVEEFFGK